MIMLNLNLQITLNFLDGGYIPLNNSDPIITVFPTPTSSSTIIAKVSTTAMQIPQDPTPITISSSTIIG